MIWIKKEYWWWRSANGRWSVKHMYPGDFYRLNDVAQGLGIADHSSRWHLYRMATKLGLEDAKLKMPDIMFKSWDTGVLTYESSGIQGGPMPLTSPPGGGEIEWLIKSTTVISGKDLGGPEGDKTVVAVPWTQYPYSSEMSEVVVASPATMPQVQSVASGIVQDAVKEVLEKMNDGLVDKLIEKLGTKKKLISVPTLTIQMGHESFPVSGAVELENDGTYEIVFGGG